MTGEKISLCAITGNCEGIIGRFIEQFRPLVDEICIVRAIGNQKHDGTLRKALAAGCRVGEYFNRQNKEWPHVDDFAAARNVAWEMASHEWLMWADIDDNITADSIEEFRRLIENAPAEVEMIRCPYVVPDQHIHENIRERIVRRGTFKWIMPVHECLKENDGHKYQYIDTRKALIAHEARSDRRASCERNIRILEAIPENERSWGTYFYLFSEKYGLGLKTEAIEIGQRFLKMKDAGEVEKYEALLILATLCESPDEMSKFLHAAHQISPDRREALCELCNLEITFGNRDRAMAYFRQLRALPKPERNLWNVRRKFYAWASDHLETQVLRFSGRPARADALEYNHFRDAGGKISLLHATRGRPIQASRARLTWLETARNPDAIEHIFAIDADDVHSECLQRFRNVVVSGEGGCVEAWNVAAYKANGEILIQLSDDWIPPWNWDEALLARMGSTETPKVLAINDGYRTDNLLCMAILTRARWEQQGRILFEPSFKGVYSDNWFSRCAYRDGVVIEARDLEFTHCHPMFGTAETDETYARQNSAEAYAKGKETFERLLKIDPIHGWYNYSPFYGHISGIIPDGTTLVEIGCWKGKSICDLALRLQSRKWKGRIAVVDTFLGEVGQTEHEGCGYFRDEFEQNIKSCGVADMIEILEGDSAISSNAFADGSVWFAYIDAAHDYESVCRDIRAWWPKISEGGILAGHDMQHWEVKNAVRDVLGNKAHDSGIIWMAKK